MPGRMIVLRIFIFCCSDVGDSSMPMLCLFTFALVIAFYMAHFRDEISRIPRYVYGSFCEGMESCCL